MQYEQALSLFSQNLTINCSDRRFMVTLVDFQIQPDDILCRIEASFLESMEELQAGAQGGKFNSIKSGRISAGTLVDWSLLNQTNAQDFLEFAKGWDASQYYVRGSKAPRCLITEGVLHSTLTEFQGPDGATCAGMVRVRVDGGKLAFGATGPSPQARAFVSQLLKSTPVVKPSELLF